MERRSRVAATVAVGVVAAATGAAWGEPEMPAISVRSTFTVADTTPAPAGNDPAACLSIPTEFFVAADGIEELVARAARHVKAMAFLPINPDEDAIVERLFGKRQSSVQTRPLTRRA